VRGSDAGGAGPSSGTGAVDLFLQKKKKKSGGGGFVEVERESLFSFEVSFFKAPPLLLLSKKRHYYNLGAGLTVLQQQRERAALLGAGAGLVAEVVAEVRVALGMGVEGVDRRELGLGHRQGLEVFWGWGGVLSFFLSPAAAAAGAAAAGIRKRREEGLSTPKNANKKKKLFTSVEACVRSAHDDAQKACGPTTGIEPEVPNDGIAPRFTRKSACWQKEALAAPASSLKNVPTFSRPVAWKCHAQLSKIIMAWGW